MSIHKRYISYIHVTLCTYNIYFLVRYVYIYIFSMIWYIRYCTQASRQLQFRRSSALQISWHSSESPSRTTCKQKVKVSRIKGQLQKWRCLSFSCLYLLSFYVTRAWSRKEYATIMTLKKFEYDAQAPLAIVVFCSVKLLPAPRFMEWKGAEKLHTGLSPLTNRYQVCIMPPLPQIDSSHDNNDSKTENEKKKTKINKSRTE